MRIDPGQGDNSPEPASLIRALRVLVRYVADRTEMSPTHSRVSAVRVGTRP